MILDNNLYWPSFKEASCIFYISADAIHDAIRDTTNWFQRRVAKVGDEQHTWPSNAAENGG